jgi:peroxiredoxin
MFLKTLIPPLLIVLSLLQSCKNEPSISITGNIVNADGKKVFLKMLQNESVTVLDSTILSKDGKFRFKTPVKPFPEFYFLTIDKSSIPLLIDSLKKISVNASFPNLVQSADVQGNAHSAEVLRFEKDLLELRQKYENYQKEWSDMDDEPSRDKLTSDIITEIRNFKQDVRQSILKFPRSFYGYYALYQRIDNNIRLFNPYVKEDYQIFGALATSLNIYYSNAPRTKALYMQVTQALQQQKKEQLNEMIQNAPDMLPDVAAPDLTGDTLRLSDYKGKLVILNYWFSDNKESRAMNRTLHSLYSKYRVRGLEIFQFSVDKSRLLWEQAVEDDRIIWPTVSDLKGAESRFVWIYNVREVPVNFLIGRDGKMIGKFNNPAELEDKIKEVL